MTQVFKEEQMKIAIKAFDEGQFYPKFLCSCIHRVHGQRAIVADIAARNFLANKDLSLQLCDFSESLVKQSSGWVH